MLASGLRTGEALALKWSDFRDVKSAKVTTLMVTVRGTKSGARKTGGRKVLALPEILGAIKELRKLHTSMTWSMGQDDLLFVSSTRAPTAEFNDDFRTMVTDLDLRPDSDEMRFTLYSCRHTYATLLLDAGLDAFHIARNMGTSVRMIDKHYGQTDFARTPELVIPL
jgi:integrase